MVLGTGINRLDVNNQLSVCVLSVQHPEQKSVAHPPLVTAIHPKCRRTGIQPDDLTVTSDVLPIAEANLIAHAQFTPAESCACLPRFQVDVQIAKIHPEHGNSITLSAALFMHQDPRLLQFQNRDLNQPVLPPVKIGDVSPWDQAVS